MNKIDQIKYGMKLDEEKAQLESMLAVVKNKINSQRKKCSHISVNLGSYNMYSTPDEESCCLLCGKGKNREFYYSPVNVVHAEDYLPQYNISDNRQCNAKFEHIQTIAIGILKDNPEMSNKELTDKLNDLIKKSLNYQAKSPEISGPKLVKTIK